ncbi:DnaD domain protein [Lysinibacillus fusiformis]|uniref:DnaD domain protein n=1 Tax=Lysinibacillus fusiformis TaxID=28031 RepID=UPI0000F38F63|nr:DnaD domain protein [Lysinibacillus fusiformis]EAZ84551.1 phage replication protein [Bacillus sp. B14905]MED4076324.1 DnaD domain protein [Lysinibacillus fusiformis]
MAKFRLVHTSFWNDPRVVEEMTAEDKYFFLYLLTNESTTQIGIYQITKKQIAFDLGYSPESANALLQRFIEHHKLIRYNAETREIAIKNWGKYNLVRGGKPILDCVKSELKNVKDATLIEWVGESVPNDSIRNVYQTYYDTHHDTATIRDEKEESSNTKGFYVTSHDTSTISGQEEQQQQDKQQEKEEEKEQQQEKKVGQSVSSSSDFAKLVEFTNQNITPVLPTIAEHLGYILDDFKDVDLILAALQNAVLNNARNKIKYAEGTLINWRKDMITTYQQLQLKAKEAQRDERNSQGYERHSNNEYDGLSL